MIINGNKRNRDVQVPLKCGTGGELRVSMNQHTEGHHRRSCMLPVCYFTQEERDSGKEEENEVLRNHPQEGKRVYTEWDKGITQVLLILG